MIYKFIMFRTRIAVGLWLGVLCSSSLAAAASHVITACQPTPIMPDRGPNVSIEYEEGSRQIQTVISAPRRRDFHKTIVIHRIGDGLKGRDPKVIFQGPGFQLIIWTKCGADGFCPASLTLQGKAGGKSFGEAMSCSVFDQRISDGKSCQAQGGRWWTHPPGCDLPSSDANQECFDSKDCESSCIVDDKIAAGTKAKGHCYGRTGLIGTCLKYVIHGVVQNKLCVD